MCAGSAPWLALRRWLVRGLIGLVAVAACCWSAAPRSASGSTARIDDRSHADVILVLGAAQYNGDPSSILQARLNHAKSLYDEGVARQIVTVGGRQAERPVHRGPGRRDVPVPTTACRQDRITEVNTGNDTLTSLRAVGRRACRQHGWRTAVLVSDPWHMFRSETMAVDSGIDAWTSPTHSGPAVQTRQTQVRYIVRETAALLYYRADQGARRRHRRQRAADRRLAA